MAISEHPALGAVLMCDFSTGFIVPKMVKKRQVLVVSPKITGRSGLCTVVPLSTTAPDPVMQYHCQIDLPAELPDWMQKSGVWVKADMMVAVSFQRLDFIRIGKERTGKRRYCYRAISDADLKRARKAILAGLGIAQLTKML